MDDPSRTGASLDQPPSQGPIRTYVIASLPRTGSTMLTRSLEVAGAGVPAEYLNPLVRDELAQRWGREPLGAYLEHLRSARTTNGVFGIKVHFNHFEPIWRRAAIHELLGAAIWISLTRLDHVAQAVSLDLARRTGRWWHSSRRRFARYDRTAITHRLAEIEQQESGWERFYISAGITPLRLVTENLVERPHDTIGAVLAAIGIEADPEVVTRPSDDPRTERWANRYRDRG